MVKAALLEAQCLVGTTLTHRQSASRRCCPCQRLLKTAIRTSEGKTGDNASSQRNERDTSTILRRTTGVKRGIAYRARAPRQRSFRTIDLQKMNQKFRTGLHEQTGVSLKERLPNNSREGYTREHQDTAQSRHRQRPPPPSSASLSTR